VTSFVTTITLREHQSALSCYEIHSWAILDGNACKKFVGPIPRDFSRVSN